nr:hypothetical protein [Tanacetum cinerariifolium]
IVPWFIVLWLVFLEKSTSYCLSFFSRTFVASVTLSLDVAVGRRPSVVDGGSLLVDDSSKIFVGGELVLSGSGNASSGCVPNFNTAFKVKFSLLGLAFLPKWYWKMYLWPSACDSMLGTWYVSLSSTELTTELQSGTKVCASGLKHVIVVVVVPSSMIALK